MVCQPAWTRMGLVILAAVGLVAVLSGGGQACDTPVYRYAMYRWTPTPYELYYFHEDFWQDEKYIEPDTTIRQAVQKMSTDVQQPANVIWLPVNTFVDRELRSVPPDVRKMWQQQEKKTLPRYLLVSPQGAPLFSGNIEPDEIASLTTSTAREQIAELLADGRSGVFLLLEGNDQDANTAAEKVLNELAADVADGKVELYAGPQTGFEPATAASAPQNVQPDKKDNAPQHRMGVVSLDRKDPKEHWLVEMLLAIEPDLKEKQFEDQPMIFVVYGRGRALPPYIGKGITRDNMLDVLHFITSACSCTVKEQNPGVDLLARYDWETAAEKLAERFGTEEGNESFAAPDEFFPELIVGAGPKPATQPVDDQPQEAAVASPVSVSQSAANDSDNSSTPVEVEPDPIGESAVVEEPAGTDEPAHSTNSEEQTSAKDDAAGQAANAPQVAALEQDASSTATPAAREDVAPTTNSWMYTLGIGIGIGIFMLVAASFLLFRNR